MLRKEKVVVYALSSFLCNTLGRSGSLLFLKRGVESLELECAVVFSVSFSQECEITGTSVIKAEPYLNLKGFGGQ
jgi:hypothetical protein